MGIAITNSSLFSAIESAELDVVQDLLTAGISPNAMEDGHPALHRAVYAGDTLDQGVVMRRRKIACLLIKAGADVNSTDWLSLTALMAAASTHANPDAIRMLLAAGALVNKGSDDGETALMFAARGPIVDIISFERGLPDRAREPEAFHQLKKDRRRHLHAVKTLVQHGADINATDKSGTSVLDYAEQSNLKAIAKFLLQKGAKRGSRVAE